MLADRLRFKRRSGEEIVNTTVVAGQFELKGDYTVGYSTLGVVIGSMSPTQVFGLTIQAVMSQYNNFGSFFIIDAPDVSAVSFKRVEVWSGSTLLASYLGSAASVSTSRLTWASAYNLINGATYTIRFVR